LTKRDLVWLFCKGFYMGNARTIRFAAAIILVIQGLACAAPNSQNTKLKTGAVNLNQYWRLTFQQDYVADDRGGDICFTQADMGLVCKPFVDWLELGINYRRIYQKTDADPYKAVNRPHMNVALSGRVLAFDITSASWFEYRNQENQKDFWRYGNRFTVKFPFLFTPIKLQPYLSHNFSADLTDASDYAGSGFSSGASLRLSRNLTGDLYYRWQTSRYDGARYDYTILGTSLRLTF
jgi:hypothetical protein